MQIDFLVVSLRYEDGPKVHVDGRQNALKSLKDGLPSIECCPHWLTLQVPSNRLLAFALGAVRWIGLALCGQVLPLQSIVALQGRVGALPRRFNYSGTGRLSASSPIIYVDGVRLAHIAGTMQNLVGGRVLIDFDDLMSRRVSRMSRNHEDISFGGFVRFVPRPIGILLQKIGPLRAILLKLEKRLLRRAELGAAQTVDAIAFASAYEARLFRRFQRRFAPEANPMYLVLGPSTRHIGGAAGDTIQRQRPQDLRFIFIGSDSQQQNRVTIEAILDLAREGALALRTHIYGRMARNYEQPDGVLFCGFVEKLAQVYQPGSILLMPRSVRGGVKSKILEAFDHGIPTIGTSSGLEDFEGPYPWRLDEAALRRLLGDESALREGYVEAVAAGTAICALRFSSRRYWQTLRHFARSGAEAEQQNKEGLALTSDPHDGTARSHPCAAVFDAGSFFRGRKIG